jgi:O-antigen ligase
MIINRLKNYLILIGLFLFFLFPILPTAIQSISYVLVFLVILLSNLKSISINYQKIKIYFYLSGFYWLSLVSFLWTANINGFIKEVSSNFLLVLFPLLLFIQYSLDRKLILYLKLFFVFASILLSIKILIYGSFGYMMLEHYHGNLYFYNLDFFNRILKIIPLGYETLYNAAQYTYPNKNGILHRNYSSTLYLISIIFILSLIKDNKKRYIKFIGFSIAGYFVLNIFYYRSLINIALIILLPIFYLLWTKSFITKKNIILFCSLLLGSLIFFKKNILTILEHHDIERYVLYVTSIQLIKDNFLLGIGIGDVFEVLNIKNHSLRSIYQMQELNNHSQFLFYFLATGILGFLLFAFHFLKLIFLNKNNFEILCLILVVLSNCLFENFLSRMVGIEIILIVYLIIFFKNNEMIQSDPI